MNDDDQGRRELDAAAEVFCATRAIDDAIAELAARPLDEAAADRMREVLAGPGLVQARSALRRLGPSPLGGRRPRRLRVVAVPGDPDPEESDRVHAGAAAAPGVVGVGGAA